jgi:hypothetical protein
MLLAALLAAALFSSVPLLAQGETPVEVPLSVEVLDGRGEPLDDLTADRLRVSLDGTPLPVRAVSRAAPGRVTLYFDLSLLSTGGVVEATGVLAARAPDLVALAPVEVVVSGIRRGRLAGSGA